MGGVCNQRINSPYKEFYLEEIILGKTLIYGPPTIEKLSPIPNLKFSEDDLYHQQEKENQYSPQKVQIEEKALLQIQERDLQPKEVKLSVEEFLSLKEEPELQENHIIKKEENNNMIKDSNQSIVKHKSILKQKSQNTSKSLSPKNQIQDSLSSNSQRSIKKVTFDKKIKVVYSSFRKIKY